MWHIVLYILQRLVYFIFHSSCTCSICVLMYISYGIIMGRFLISAVFWGTTIVLVRASMVRGLLEEIWYWCWQLVGLFRLAPFYLKLTEFIFAFHRKGFFLSFLLLLFNVTWRPLWYDTHLMSRQFYKCSLVDIFVAVMFLNFVFITIRI